MQISKQLCSALTLITVVILSVVGSVDAYAQNSRVRGKVVDQNGEPVVGAAVAVAGTTMGTVTDFDGKYEMSVPAGASLTVAYIGYTTVTEAVNGRTEINFTLFDEFEQLEEVQVVAYGAQKKVTVTGAISSVKSEDLVRTPVSSVNNVLAGQLSGVTTVQYSGEPGSDAASIFVRGKATWVDESPLIQVDGVEREMYDIDPSEIESITVLKDASATAVFGVRGANGVILITTKRGQEGKANIDVSTAFSALMPTEMVEMAGSYDYANFHNARSLGDGSKISFSDIIIDKFKNPKTEADRVRFPSIDWADYIMKDVALQTQSNLNISGGNDRVRYFVSAGMFTQGGLFEEFDLNYHCDYRYQRFNYRSNLDIDVTKSTTVSINVAGKLDRTQKPITSQGSSGMIKNIYGSTPFKSAGFVDGKLVYTTVNSDDNTAYYTYDDEGNITGYAGEDADPNSGVSEMLPFVGSADPLNYLNTGGRYRQDNNKLSMDLAVDQKLDFLTEGLSFKAKGAYNSSYYIQNTASGASLAKYEPILQKDGSVQYRLTAEALDPQSFSNTYGKGRDWYFEASLNYNRKFGQHTVGGLVLYNQSATYYPKTYSDIPRRYMGLVARVSYDYMNKYMAEVNFGYNGSENFKKGKRYGSFPAGSVGWAVSEEPFFGGIKHIVSFLKLRASWGLVGNDKSDTRFAYLPDPYEVNDEDGVDHAGYSYIFGASTTYGSNSTSQGAWETEKHNENLTWETAFKQDYGIDLSFFDGRLTLNGDYFLEHRKDIMLQDGTVPSVLGYRSYPYANLGEVDSWGWELSAGYNQSFGDVRVWGKFNLSYNQNEIVVDKQAPQPNEYQYTAGRRIGSRSQYKFWGLYQQGVSEQLYEQQTGDPFPTTTLVSSLKNGDAVFVDLNHDGVIDANDNSRDFGYTDDPEYIAGLNLGVSWKGLTVSAQLTGAWHVSRMISDVFRTPFADAASTGQGGLLVYHLDNTWVEENDYSKNYTSNFEDYNAKYPRATTANAGQNYATSTLYEQDSKYLRLKTAEISYNFDFPFMKTIGLKRLQLAINGYNLLTFTPYLWGDPEARATNSPSYPLQRTFTGSLKLGF